MTRFRGVIAVEGRVSNAGDRRMINRGAVAWEAHVPLTTDADGGHVKTIGVVSHIEREETPGGVLVWGMGYFDGDPLLPPLLDLSALVLSRQGDHEQEADGVLVVTRGRLAHVHVGHRKVWDECVMEVITDGAWRG